MDVSFERVPRLGTDCFRYVPLLSEKAWSPTSKDLYVNFFESRKDLAVLKTEDYWAHFLDFYALTRIIESSDGSWAMFYCLKPEVHLKFPPKLALIFAIPESGVIFDSEATVLTSKPTSGRSLEFLLLEGSFTFNEGSVFNPIWTTYQL